MIVTAQPFFDEADLMEVKFRELEGVVDLHIVVESNITYTGKPKALNFEEERFKEFPVQYIVANIPKKADSPWDREKAQNEIIRIAVNRVSPDIVLLIDADEIPRRDSIQRFIDSGLSASSLEMDHLTFFFNRKCNWMKWPFPKISRMPLKPHRHDPLPVIESAGWHCQNFGGKERLISKLESFSHANDECTLGFKAKVENGELPGIEDTDLYDDLPQFVKDNWERFAQYFQ
jgi:beta-1,4-mannosyl-glycoprotein beta-1,4-N-acetylglucosaminyltransferase